MNTSKTAIALAIGGAFVASIATTQVSAATNPFALKALTSGYMVADAKDMKDGKCGTGKCGAAKSEKMEKGAEASCGSEKMGDKMKEGSCHGEMKADKMKEGSCHSDKK